MSPRVFDWVKFNWLGFKPKAVTTKYLFTGIRSQLAVKATGMILLVERAIYVCMCN